MGQRADVIAVVGDSLRDVCSLQRVSFVMKGGGRPCRRLRELA